MYSSEKTSIKILEIKKEERRAEPVVPIRPQKFAHKFVTSLRLNSK